MNYTVYQWFNHWLEMFVLNSVKQSTYSTYLYYIESHIKPKIGEIMLNDLSVDLLQTFYNKKYKNGNLKTGKGLSSKTIRNTIKQ